MVAGRDAPDSGLGRRSRTPGPASPAASRGWSGCPAGAVLLLLAGAAYGVGRLAWRSSRRRLL